MKADIDGIFVSITTSCSKSVNNYPLQVMHRSPYEVVCMKVCPAVFEEMAVFKPN